MDCVRRTDVRFLLPICRALRGVIHHSFSAYIHTYIQCLQDSKPYQIGTKAENPIAQRFRGACTPSCSTSSWTLLWFRHLRGFPASLTQRERQPSRQAWQTRINRVVQGKKAHRQWIRVVRLPFSKCGLIDWIDCTDCLTEWIPDVCHVHRHASPWLARPWRFDASLWSPSSSSTICSFGHVILAHCSAPS